MKRDKKANPVANTLVIYLTGKDYQKVKEGQLNSTCRSLSEYGRKLVLRQRINMFYRSKSFDVFVDEAIALRNEMQALRQHLPFTKEQEAKLIILQQEIKLCINKIYDHVRQNRV